MTRTTSGCILTGRLPIRYNVAQIVVHSAARPKGIILGITTRKLTSRRVTFDAQPMRIGGNLDAFFPSIKLPDHFSHNRAPSSPSCGRAGISIEITSIATKAGRESTKGDFSSGRLDR